MMTPQAEIRLRSRRILINVKVKYGRTFVKCCYTQPHSSVGNDFELSTEKNLRKNRSWPRSVQTLSSAVSNEQRKSDHLLGFSKPRYDALSEQYVVTRVDLTLLTQ